jgi:hypothetical protein
MRNVGRLPVSDNVLHFCAYTWLALLALLAIRRRSLAVLTALATILLGVALQFGQDLVPGRAFEIRDMFINGFGILTGIAIGILQPPYRPGGQQELILSTSLSRALANLPASVSWSKPPGASSFLCVRAVKCRKMRARRNNHVILRANPPHHGTEHKWVARYVVSGNRKPRMELLQGIAGAGQR